ncbi:MAG: hypothetical protein JWP03_3792 [Phycisphaerales bacterium]|nr:hypothetical protein [Phycisphaerales bacterium]
MSAAGEPYLQPYLRAAQKYGAGFPALLWASPRTQRARFEAICQSYSPAGRSVLDAGCGRGDYLTFLIDRGVTPADYIGIEAVGDLANVAEAQHPDATILRADFVREPARLFVGADVVVFSGSLNTIEGPAFFETIRRAYDAAGEALVFNFLSSSFLAGQEYLFWHSPQDIERFARGFCADVRLREDYLAGDCTACLIKPADPGAKETVHG